MSLKNLCDIHTHTLFSRHAYSTIYENVREATAQGLEVLGSTDHFSSMLFHDVEEGKNYQYLSSQRDWQRDWLGITVLRGVEADIVDLDGNLFGDDIVLETGITGEMYPDGRKTLYRWVTRRLDYVIASIHGKSFTKGRSCSELTSMYIKALSRPEVLMLGHVGRTGLEIDTDEILKAAKAMHKLVEINEHSFAFPDEEIMSRCRKIAERCAQMEVKIAVTTDAHNCLQIGRVGGALEMLEEIHFPQELIATTDRQSLLAAVEEAVPSFRL